MNNIQSPITGNKVKFEQTILVSEIVKKYRQNFTIDVSKYFSANQNISIYKCIDTGYRFYYPFNIIGDSHFYEQLQQYDWYYMPWKWEHQKASEYINKNMQVLEIGCAKGDFIARIQKNIGCNCIGLEYNESTKEFVEQLEVLIINESIQDFSKKHKEEFDVVCSFQVLEHVPEVKDFIEAQLLSLKIGGKLIISVTNNNSFTKQDKENDILNMPPHHMGLWNKNSLKNICNPFNLKLYEIKYEPLQKYHYNWYISIFEKRFLKHILLRKIYYKFNIKKILTFFLLKLNKLIKGHTMIVIYIKK